MKKMRNFHTKFTPLAKHKIMTTLYKKLLKNWVQRKIWYPKMKENKKESIYKTK